MCSPPCQNGGRCVGGVCRCPFGWTGSGCRRDVDECVAFAYKCAFKCSNFRGGFSCVCPVDETLQPDGRSCELPRQNDAPEVDTAISPRHGNQAPSRRDEVDSQRRIHDPSFRIPNPSSTREVLPLLPSKLRIIHDHEDRSMNVQNPQREAARPHHDQRLGQNEARRQQHGSDLQHGTRHLHLRHDSRHQQHQSRLQPNLPFTQRRQHDLGHLQHNSRHELEPKHHNPHLGLLQHEESSTEKDSHLDHRRRHRNHELLRDDLRQSDLQRNYLPRDGLPRNDIQRDDNHHSKNRHHRNRHFSDLKTCEVDYQCRHGKRCKGSFF